ncbi:MAG: DNA-3-methyladenine glycosylase 1 [Microgenomates bacterium OLB22]|nr:MAG: DNA-3-methyladenine glycosylase 1 [Microgenomates bacterium OLB22]
MSNVTRCRWVPINNELYTTYHDIEWGVPVYDDRILFEFLVLESAQAGLSWEIILKKREGYRAAFAGFDPEQVARFGDEDVERLLQDTGIIRNRLKIKATITNAQHFLEIQQEFGSFSTYMWNFVGGKPIVNRWKSIAELPAKTDLSEEIAKDLKSRGFKFLGPTVIYAHMQTSGMVNDHTTDCFRYVECIAIKG